MDDYLFETNVNRCKVVAEQTNYLEIFSYSDPTLNTVEEHPLTADEYDNFLDRRGAFAPRKLPEGVTQLACMRLIIQQNAKHQDTFAPHVVSLKTEQYKRMVETMNLPYRMIEGTSVVGPFFWSAYDQDEEDPHLQIIFRKSDVRKKGYTRGWELALSTSVNTGLTTGFFKGTPSSDVVECLRHLKECGKQIQHPLLLPVIIFSHDVSFKTDIKQRDARDWLRRLEHAVSMRSEIQEREGYVNKDGVVDLDAVNRDLVECHSQVLWKRPKAYLQLCTSIENAMIRYYERLPEERRDKETKKLHSSMQSRMDFYRVKLQGIESYAYTTLQRLDIQRSALYNIIAQKESKLNFKMAGEQRKLAHASKRDSAAMKTISLLGAIFFPGAYLASVFSMTFFNFQDGGPGVSESFWIYWAVTIPVTMVIVFIWWIWERQREARYNKEDTDLEKGSEEMEQHIMATMRKRTMSKASTWDTKKSD
ncbi:hypothetical protein BP6252_07701 [Coleophoma cylindrospora]|uniref:Uncharacterized protein n=1 Tax=Coleophoma cylindrospora TaxID=1849047 RepID=A0A3D8RB38_9HELO|nr:hypothetical protein BP6252_07701 [Coleophoma cylindrospora]